MKKCALIASIASLLLIGCGSPRVVKRPDVEIERNAAAARTAYAAGAVESAARFYQKALDRARLADQPVEISRLAYNLAVCRACAQNYDEALKLLDEAQYEAGRPSPERFAQAGKTSADFQEAGLLRAEILRRLGKTNETSAIARAGIDAARKNDPFRLQFCLVLAELACDQNDGKLALAELDKADKALLKSADSATQAREADIRGRALLMENQPAEAAACFDNSAGLYQDVQRYADMGNALYRAGMAYEACNKPSKAFNRYYRAARTLALCGEKTKAQASFKQASKLAKDEPDREILEIISQLPVVSCLNGESNFPPGKALSE